MINYWQKLKKWIIATLLVGTCYAADLVLTQDKIAPELQLKTEKENIIYNIDVDETKLENGRTIKTGEHMLYLYADSKDDTAKPNEDISKRTEMTMTFNNTDGTETTRFFNRPHFTKVNNKWRELKLATTTIDAYKKQTGTLINKAWASYPPNASDGSLESWDTTAGSTGWTNARTSASSDQESTGNVMYVQAYYGDAGVAPIGPDWVVSVSFMVFDTSAIPDTDTITAASVTWTVADGGLNYDNDGYDYVGVVTHAQANTTNLATSDFSTRGTTEGTDAGEREDISGISGTKTQSLNATGMGWISKTGTTYLALDMGHDIQNHEPKSSPVGYNYIGIATTESANDPYLDVTYEAEGGGETAIPPPQPIIGSWW